jgi:lysophospholipase L1-like esterase
MVAVNGRQLVRTKVAIRDLFIVGLGDSFASGEGNPDVPVQFADNREAGYGIDPDGQPLLGYPTRAGDWRKMGDGAFLRAAALWQSRACHRSLYSYQLRAALQLALEDPHRAVTYVGFACSGSEVTIGLFLRYKGNEWDRYPPQLPQLSYISEELCGKGTTSPKDYTSGYTQMGKLPELQGMILNKCYQPRRQIDLLLVSIGGNDVGFARLLANAVLSDEGLLRSLGGWMGSVQSAGESVAALETLKTRYTALNKAFHYMLRIPWSESDRIILTSYPYMAYTEDAQSVCPSGNLGMDLYPDFSADAKKLTEDERFGDNLYQVMKTSAAKLGWTFVDEQRQQFKPHGFCAHNNDPAAGTAEMLGLPRRLEGKDWSPYKPSEFRAYASRQRWFRTPNDAYMTAHFHALDPITKQVLGNKRLKWFQIIMAGTYSGSFHPTAEGHAVIADAVVRKARTVLDKYASRPVFVADVPRDEKE